jgi:outer membrane protein assembly factor BamB
MNARFVRLLLGMSSSFCALVGAGRAESPAPGQGWPQWGGPQRDFKVQGAALAATWPEGGPKKLWHRELGDGYATIAADGDRLYTMYRKDGRELTTCLEASTGKTLWEQGETVEQTKQMEDFGAGPHSTPLIVGGRVFSAGILGLVQGFDKTDGKPLWRHELAKEFGLEEVGFGYSCSPLAYQNSVILTVGGKEGQPHGQALVAFDQETGSVKWKAQDFKTTHSSPILIEFGGRPQLVVFTAEELAGVNPDDGSLLWRHPHPTQYGANLSTPAWDGRDHIVCSAAYDSGTRCIKLTQKDGATVPEELWYTKKMKVQHATIIIDGGKVYASSGDFGPAFFMCADVGTGKLDWRERGFSKANAVFSGGKLLLLDQDGNLALTSVTPDGMTVHARCKVAEPYAWAAPTQVGTKLYIRDRKHIMALEVG